MDEETHSIIDLAFLFFSRYSLSEYIFFYFLLQLLLQNASPEKSELFDLLSGRYRDLPKTSRFIGRPTVIVVLISGILLFSSFLSIMASMVIGVAIELLPSIWLILFSTEIKKPEFNWRLAFRDGTIFISIAWLIIYASNRNNDINEITKNSDSELT